MSNYTTVETKMNLQNGKCEAQYIVCKCIVSTIINTEKTYLGTAQEDFKKRYNNQRRKKNRHKWYSK